VSAVATRLAARVLRRSVALLPADRREWGEAVWAESGAVPEQHQLDWLLGGLWLVARQLVSVARLAYWIGLGAVAALAGWVVRDGWQGSALNPATDGNRVRVIALVIALAALPWLGRRRGLFGPASGSGIVRAVRIGGCVAICAVVFAASRVSQFAGARFATGKPATISWTQLVQLAALVLLTVALFVTIREPRRDSVSTAMAACGAVAMLLLVPVLAITVGYVAGTLILTARRTHAPAAAVGPGSVAGVLAGAFVYCLMPAAHLAHLANPWVAAARDALLVGILAAVPVGIGYLAARLTAARLPPGGHAEAGIRCATFAGAAFGGAGAATLTALTVYTLALHPTQVHLEPDGPHGPPHTAYEIQMSVGDTAENYLAVLMLGPLLGAGLAVGGNAAWTSHARRRTTRFAAARPTCGETTT
jgi:hypothetical protein